MQTIQEQCQLAYEAKTEITIANSELKNKILDRIAHVLEANQDLILSENQKDMDAAKTNGTGDALLDRLLLTTDRIQAMIESIRQIQSLPDPVSQILDEWERPNGLKIQKRSCPFGVIAMIYEARPNVTIDAIALAIKSGNAIVLRGSSSAYQSNQFLTQAIKSEIKDLINPECIQLVQDLDRSSVTALITMNGVVDLVIPRGGQSLIQHVVQHATIPSIETGIGNCHVYIDADADLKTAKSVTLNAKVQRPSVCNACESILVHKDVAESIIPELTNELIKEGVDIFACQKSIQINPTLTQAKPEDWGTEYHDYKVSLKIVDSLTEGIAHINQYGTLHSEAIITENVDHAERFFQSVDAASVLHNASTRFTDGGEFGFGSEIGISTQKLHARGPFGLEALCSYKYIVMGQGQVRR